MDTGKTRRGRLDEVVIGVMHDITGSTDQRLTIEDIVDPLEDLATQGQIERPIHRKVGDGLLSLVGVKRPYTPNVYDIAGTALQRLEMQKRITSEGVVGESSLNNRVYRLRLDTEPLADLN